MTLAAAALYPDFVAELEAASGKRPATPASGALHVALDRDEAAELRRVHDLQRSLGLEAEWLPPRRCRELEPGLTPSFNGGVHAPGEAAADPRALTAGAAGGARRRRRGEVRTRVRGRRRGSSRASASPGSGPPPARSCVPTRRPGHRRLGRPRRVAARAARPPVRPVKGEVLELRAPRRRAAPCERIVASERVYLVPRPDGRLIVGATVEELGFDTAVTAGGVHELLREAYRLLPDVAEMELVGSMAGLRPGTPDNLPLVGPGAVDGLLLATGHYRNGILLAPLTADTIAALLVGGHSWRL